LEALELTAVTYEHPHALMVSIAYTLHLLEAAQHHGVLHADLLLELLDDVLLCVVLVHQVLVVE
jgi:hypothetical protein